MWCGESSLKSQFPNLFRIACFKEATVDQMFSRNGEHVHWDLSLVRSTNDWEEESVCNLLTKLVAMEVKVQVNDELVWPYDSKGSFNIKSFCKAIYDRSLCPGFPSQLFGGQKLLQKLFFCLGCHLRKISRGLFEKKKFPWA